MEANMIQKIGQIGVPIKNMENAIAFQTVDKLEEIRVCLQSFLF